MTAIPTSLIKGDSASWSDDPYVDGNGTTYNSSSYTLKYSLAGPGTSPLVLTAVLNGLGWITTLSTTSSAALTPGQYWWQAQLFATGVRLTIKSGDLVVEPDLATLGSGTYDGRSFAEKALADAEVAYSTFSKSGGAVKEYVIGHRQMRFQDLDQIKNQVDYWRSRVQVEQASAKGAGSRLIKTRFNRV